MNECWKSDSIWWSYCQKYSVFVSQCRNAPIFTCGVWCFFRNFEFILFSLYGIWASEIFKLILSLVGHKESACEQCASHDLQAGQHCIRKIDVSTAISVFMLCSMQFSWWWISILSDCFVFTICRRKKGHTFSQYFTLQSILAVSYQW